MIAKREFTTSSICRRAFGLASSATVLAIAGQAFAQEAEAPAAEGGLDVITVTAQRVEERIEDVPLSVATVSGEKLDVLFSGGLDIRSLSGRVPSLRIESSFGRTFPRFYIRGLGNTDFDLNASQPVSFVYDEVVMENPVVKGMPIFDVDRVEVLRGPQGTLFGRNTPAGIVKLDSRKPTDEFGGYAQASYGRYNTVNWEGAVGGPIADGVMFRVATIYQHRSDWVDNAAAGPQSEFGGYNDFGYRAQLLLEPSDRLTALFNIHGRIYDGDARLFRANIITPGSNAIVDDFDRETVFYDGRNKQKVRQIGGQIRLEYDLGGAMLTSISSVESVETFSRGDIDGGFGAGFIGNDVPAPIPFPAESADGLPEHDQLTQEIRLTGPLGDKVTYQVGGFYFYEDISIDSFNFDSLAPGNPQNGYARQEQLTNAWALFAHLDFDATDRLNLQAGVRYSNEEKDFVAERTQSPIGGGATGIIGVNPSDDDISWNVAATYAVTDATNIYARVATSFRAPSIQGRLLFGDVVTVADTEEIFSVEGGVKTATLDNKARFSLTGFWYDVDDQQLTAVGGGANFNQLVNADKTRGYGFEFDGEFAPNDHLLFTAGLSYNFTRIIDPGLFIQPCGGGCTVLDPAGPIAGTVAINGNPLPHAPKWIVNATFRISEPMANGGQIFLFGDAAYSSEANFFLYESAEFRDDIFEAGLRLGYLSPNGDWEAAIYGRNVTNSLALNGGIDFNNLTGFVNEPPMWGFEISKRF
ncbi:MAG: TonB-dependent receptor [Alphaproteobacteria bacterium]|nr:TonB-dependent receptor [Alphaproteobacteria bacterium]